MKNDILVVDDDPNVRKLFASILMQQHYTVLTAKSGIEALELLKKHAFRLILLDLNMPGMDGHEALLNIRSLDSDVPIFMITAFANERFDELKAIRERGVEFQLLKKPIEKAKLLLFVDGVLSKKLPEGGSLLKLKLFVAGPSKATDASVEQLHAIFREAWPGEYVMDVIDVFEFPDIADQNRVIATPTLCKILPEPVKRVIGDLSIKKMVLRALEI